MHYLLDVYDCDFPKSKKHDHCVSNWPFILSRPWLRITKPSFWFLAVHMISVCFEKWVDSLLCQFSQGCGFILCWLLCCLLNFFLLFVCGGGVLCPFPILFFLLALFKFPGWGVCWLSYYTHTHIHTPFCPDTANYSE